MKLRARQKFGKYVIEGRIADGGFAVVYKARDTIEGVRVALKVPHEQYLTKDVVDLFRKEARLAARLDHPNILPLKYADFIDGTFVIVTALAPMTLGDRMQRRISLRSAIDFTDQMMQAVSVAHENRIIHCDVKPDNFLVFPKDRLRLTDFGIARVERRSQRGSGQGTVGYVAPEQAMGIPSYRSDVFSLGIILYRMFSGHLPEWPYRWPMEGHARLKERLHPDFIELIRRAIEVDDKKRFKDATQMRKAFTPIRARALRAGGETRAKKRRPKNGKTDWEMLKRRQFLQEFGKKLDTRFECGHCHGPVSEAMATCPWCGKPRKVHDDTTRFPQICPRCHRGMKLDWAYCPWCHGPGFEVTSNKEFSDKAYAARCSNAKCDRKLLMPFMRYCPWCKTKVRRKWKIPDCPDKCRKCGWGVAKLFWSYCPWCGSKP